MPKEVLPKFIVFQPNQKEFHFCLEVHGKFFRWCSYYPPTLDVRYPRALTRMDDIPIGKIPKKQIIDEGSFTIRKSATKESIENKIDEGIKMKSFTFILNGKKLKGRFAIKKNLSNTVLQKFKDKFAVEEDVLSGDLARTISTMVPNYDAKKIDLNRLSKVKQHKPVQKEVLSTEPAPVEELSADKEIGGIHFHFAFYTSTAEPDVCLITTTRHEVVVLTKTNNKWVMQISLDSNLSKNKKKLVAHADLLYNSKNF